MNRFVILLMNNPRTMARRLYAVINAIKRADEHRKRIEIENPRPVYNIEEEFKKINSHDTRR